MMTCLLIAMIVAASAQPDAPQSYIQEIPEAAFKFEMLAIPGDENSGIKPFWLSKTEITWEAFDVFIYRLDEQTSAPASVDAVTRPTKPYLPPDRGFGHDGFAAISMSYKTAAAFCAWLSARTGRKYRLPTEAEWEHAARAGSHDAFDDVRWLGKYAWFADNSEATPHAVSMKKPNRWGLYDMLGNVQEWCTDAEGKPVTKGGSYRDSAEKLKVAARALPEPSWNASDPQIPKSSWWLSDAPFVGFRVVCEMPEDEPATAPATQPGSTSSDRKE
jgi:formylglycine-generating enzyme required for sulfatase activity